ncbi:helix-turn-helix transcriptional regulator [Ponticoccus gilvus]|nr:helix-turn-helix transcriptional regulator [Enemella evansiae]
MDRFWVGLGALVAVVAGIKTLLVAQFVLQPGSADATMLSALFALFFALTSAVAYVCFTQFQALMARQRKEKLAPGAGEVVTKETVIARYAPDWGLSQAEADVAIFVAKGFSNNEIAEMRGCALATVKSQLSKIYQKSGLGSRYQLIAFVTDEAVSVATEDSAASQPATPTRKILPLVGRAPRDRDEPVETVGAQGGR